MDSDISTLDLATQDIRTSLFIKAIICWSNRGLVSLWKVCTGAEWVGFIHQSTTEVLTLVTRCCDDLEAADTTAVVVATSSVNLVQVRTITIACAVQFNTVDGLLTGKFEVKEGDKVGRAYLSAVRKKNPIIGCVLALIIQNINTSLGAGDCIAEAESGRNWTAAICITRGFGIPITRAVSEVKYAAIVRVATGYKLGEFHFRRGVLTR